MKILEYLRLLPGRLIPALRREQGSRAQISGRRGEKLAVKHLKRNGYRILARNWRWKRYELDIVAEKDGVIVFAETKTRNTDAFGQPYEFIDRDKRRSLSAAATAFIKSHRLHDRIHRFDVISIILPPGGEPQIQQIENAF